MDLRLQYADINVLTIQADCGNEESLVQAISTVVAKFGRIDYAVNNAGIPGVLGPATEYKTSDFKTVLDVNLTGLWIAQREQIRQMLKQDPLPNFLGVPGNRGAIVNTSSVMGLTGSPDEFGATAYSATKHAVLGLTRSESNMYSSQSIRINAVCPGFIETPLLRFVGSEEATKQTLPMRRFGDPAEVAQVISFLASPMSSYVTGASVTVDG